MRLYEFEDRDYYVKLGGRVIPIGLSDFAAADGFHLVEVNVAAFDRAFSREKTYYIGRGGAGGIRNRYGRFAEFVRDCDYIEASDVHVNEEGRISFTNGRHRYAYMRDAGLKRIPVAMDSDSIKNAADFGYI